MKIMGVVVGLGVVLEDKGRMVMAGFVGLQEWAGSTLGKKTGYFRFDCSDFSFLGLIIKLGGEWLWAWVY